MDDLWDVVGRSDIVYTATSCEDYVIDAQKMEENGLASGRPLMLVDISVPRNVGEDCNDVSTKEDIPVLFTILNRCLIAFPPFCNAVEQREGV